MIAAQYYYPLKKHLQTHHLTDKKMIAAVSGGADSMAMCYVLMHLQIDFVIAHCNFQLRGEESNGDEAYVKAWAQQHNIPCFVQHLDTKGILDTAGGNLQVLCRDLRYAWFETLRTQLKYDYIATAHHKDDIAETVIMNLMRGTGIAGLHGILPIQGKIVRPLLPIDRKDIVAILQAQNCQWREDSSNAKDNYLRNKIRHHLLPLMREIVPQAIDGIYATSTRMQDVEAIIQPNMQQANRKLIEQRGKDFYIGIRKLQLQPGYATLLFELLQPFGVTSAQMVDVLQLLEAHTGKYLATDEYRIIKNRNVLIITAQATVDSQHILIHQEDITSNIVYPIGELSFATSKQLTEQDNPNIIQLTADKLEWPMVLRPVKEGDYFYPFGMGMKKKKVSKLLKDIKMPIHEKEQVWVLESNQKVVWVLGLRMDERYKIKDSTSEILTITHTKKDF